jgi:transcriptional antiterminator RfaH
MSESSLPVHSWFLIYAKPRQEQVAKLQLERQGYVVYLPLTHQERRRAGKRVTVVEALFPRYLFICLNTSTDDWGPIRSTIGVSSLVRFGMEPARVPDALIELLRSRESESGFHHWAEPKFRSGQSVRVTEGAMRGYEGIFVARSGRERALVLLDILGRQVRARVTPAQLEAAE